MFAGRETGVLFVRPGVVVFYPAGADEEDVAGQNVAALRGGADVEVLPFAARNEFVVRDGEGGRGVVADVLGFGVAFVV